VGISVAFGDCAFGADAFGDVGFELANAARFMKAASASAAVSLGLLGEELASDFGDDFGGDFGGDAASALAKKLSCAMIV